jgi:hypothetical protein
LDNIPGKREAGSFYTEVGIIDVSQCELTLFGVMMPGEHALLSATMLVKVLATGVWGKSNASSPGRADGWLTMPEQLRIRQAARRERVSVHAWTALNPSAFRHSP